MSSHLDSKPGAHHQNVKQEPTHPIAGSSTSTGHPNREPTELQSILSKQLGPEFLSTRPGAGGSKLTYIEGWRVIALANEIFGYDGWSSETKSIEVDFVDQTSEGRFNVGVSATVKISLRNGGSHEDVGYGKLENSRSKADALDKCKKEAVTDALKRTLRTFGNLMGNCLYDKTYLNNVKTMQAQKEKFMPSKLYRPDHVTNTSRPSNVQAETKSFKETASTSEEEEKVIQKPTTTTRPAPPPLLNKPSPQTLASKQPTTAQFVSKPSAIRHFPSKPAVAAPLPPPPRPILLHTEAEKNKNSRISPPVPGAPVPKLMTSKRKFQDEEAVEKQQQDEDEEEDEDEEDEPTMNDEEEETNLAPPPATLSDKYFEFDEAELAELAQAESSCGIGGRGGGGSPDESGLITDTSLVTNDGDTTTSNTTILGDDRHLPSKGAVQAKTFNSTRPPPPPPPRLVNNAVGKVGAVASAGQLPTIKSNVLGPTVQSSIRYPSVPNPRKPSLLNPHPPHQHQQQQKHQQQLYQQLGNRTVKKVRTSND